MCFVHVMLKFMPAKNQLIKFQPAAMDGCGFAAGTPNVSATFALYFPAKREISILPLLAAITFRPRLKRPFAVRWQ